LKKKKTYVIACAVLALDLKRIAGELGLDIGTRFLPAGLHENPDLLRKKLQAAVDEVSHRDDCERIIVGYGSSRSIRAPITSLQGGTRKRPNPSPSRKNRFTTGTGGCTMMNSSKPTARMPRMRRSGF